MNGSERSADPELPNGQTGGKGPEGHCKGRCSFCTPNIILNNAMTLLCLVHCLFIPGFSAPYWISYHVAADQGHRGLWQRCIKVYSTTGTTDKFCSGLFDPDNRPNWLEATQGLMVTALITLVLATVLLIYWICSNSRYLCVKVFIILLVLCSGAGLLVYHCLFSVSVSTTGMIVYGLNADENSNDFSFDWCFYLLGVSTVVLFTVPTLLLHVPSRRKHLCDKPHGSSNFNSERTSLHESGTSAMVPEQGISTSETNGYTYPSLAPATKTYGDTDYLYPNSRPSTAKYEEIDTYMYTSSPSLETKYEHLTHAKP